MSSLSNEELLAKIEKMLLAKEDPVFISSHAKVIWSFSPTLLRISNTRFFK